MVIQHHSLITIGIDYSAPVYTSLYTEVLIEDEVAKNKSSKPRIRCTAISKAIVVDQSLPMLTNNVRRQRSSSRSGFPAVHIKTIH